MSDELRRIYEGQGALDRYYDDAIPTDLFRGRRTGDATELMQPTLLGWYSQGQPRHPDILIEDVKHTSPQYTDRQAKLVVDTKTKSLTADLVANADKYVVKGCRTMQGDHRGLSVFDKKNTRLINFEWFRLRQGTLLPIGLACTRDSHLKISSIPIHYTIAPKDDMPLSLFLQQLKTLAVNAEKDEQR